LWILSLLCEINDDDDDDDDKTWCMSVMLCSCSSC